LGASTVSPVASFFPASPASFDDELLEHPNPKTPTANVATTTFKERIVIAVISSSDLTALLTRLRRLMKVCRKDLPPTGDNP
jgi:hypothetical protein